VIAEGLSQDFRFFGAAAFWIQLFLGVVSGLLLAFGYVGHTVSPGGSRFDAIDWASVALGLLAFSGFFTHAYMRAAPRLKRDPSRYLGDGRRGAFWFVTLAGVVSGLALQLHLIWSSDSMGHHDSAGGSWDVGSFDRNDAGVVGVVSA
jgi:hypothetical protein